jgi:hypothetical protein
MALHDATMFNGVFDPKALEESHNCFYALVVECASVAQKYAQKNQRNVEIYPSPKIIHETFMSAYIDIARYKQFHLDDPKVEKSDAVKRAAYFTKWIVRLRPLLIIDREQTEDPSPVDDPLVFLNEDLALQWGLLCIAQDNRLTDLFLRKKVHADFLYYLHFREISADGWLSTFQLVDDVADARNDNPLIEFPSD